MSKYDQPIERLIEYFRTLPGVGYKTAQRYAYSIIEGDKDRAKNFAESILEVKEKIGLCKECGNYTDKEICDICSKRDKKTICVVKEPKDILAMEKVKSFEEYKGWVQRGKSLENPVTNCYFMPAAVKEKIRGSLFSAQSAFYSLKRCLNCVGDTPI